jgi:hypothetical protein
MIKVSKVTRVKSTHRFIVAPYGDSRPADYTCADNTNNQVEINAAINAAVTAHAMSGRGCTVDLLDGDFYIGGRIIPKNYVWLRGQGMFATRIHATSSLNNGMLDNKSDYSPASPYTGGTISDLELDGSGMDQTRELKGLNSDNLNSCLVTRLYVHDTTATGIGPDDFYGSIVDNCYVANCGYMNKRTITAASWSGSVFSYTTSADHGYSVGTQIIITGMTPATYNGKYNVTTVPTSTTFTISSSNNSGSLTIAVDPGTATGFGITSDSRIGHNGIGIASGANYSEATLVTNNVCISNQNNNFLIEADDSTTGQNASYIFANNVSISAGQSGFLNTGSINVQFNNNYDYGSVYGIQVNPVMQSRTINAASWSANVATYGVTAAHGYSVGSKVTVTGMTPAGYNGVYYVASIPTSTTFTIAMTVDPGTATVFGSAQTTVHPTDGTQIQNNTLSNNLLYGIRVGGGADGYSAIGNTVKDCYNYGISANGSKGQIMGCKVSGSGRSGIILETGTGSYTPIERVDIVSTQVYNNSKRVASNDGIELKLVSTAGISNINIRGCQCYDDQQTKTQRYGIILRSGGTMSNINVDGNNLSGNLTGSMLVQNTSSTIYDTNNVGYNTRTLVKTSGYTTSRADYVILVNSTSAPVTITLPTAVGIEGKELIVKDYLGQAATNNITIATTSAQTIDGASTKVLSTNYISYKVISDGANWSII